MGKVLAKAGAFFVLLGRLALSSVFTDLHPSEGARGNIEGLKMQSQVFFLKTWTLDGYYIGRSKPPEVDFICPTTDVQINISREKEGFEAIVKAKVGVDISDNQWHSALDLIAAIQEGRFEDARWDDLDAGLKSLCWKADAVLRDQASRFIKLIRWFDRTVGGLDIIPEEYEAPNLYWKADESDPCYVAVPQLRVQEFSVSMPRWQGIDTRSPSEEDFCALWRSEISEDPLAHQLAREARELSQPNPRAALLLAHAALEVAVKRHISLKVPITQWLMDESPAPPLRKMILGYLPLLNTDSILMAKMDEAKSILRLSKKLDDFSKARNDLAHRGHEGTDRLFEFLTLTTNILYLIDLLEGHEWASRRLDPEFAEAFGLKVDVSR